MKTFSYTDNLGYAWVKAPEGHPYPGNCNWWKGRRCKTAYIKRSRLVMEGIVGRHITPSEAVHHINGIKNDDRPENLQLLTMSEHSQLHKQFNNPRARVGAPSGKVECIKCKEISRHNVKRGLCNACYLQAKRLKHKTGKWPDWACLFPTKREAGVSMRYAP